MADWRHGVLPGLVPFDQGDNHEHAYGAGQRHGDTTNLQSWIRGNIIPLLLLLIPVMLFVFAQRGDNAKAMRVVAGVVIALAVLGVALLVAVVGIVADKLVESSRTEESAVLASGLSAALAPVISPDEDKAAVPDDQDEKLLSFESIKARATEAIKQFEKAENKTGDTLALISVLGKAGAT